MHSFGKKSKKRHSPENRIFNRRNGLQIIQLENCRFKASTLTRMTFSSKTGSSIEEMGFRSFSWNAEKNCDSVSRRDTFKKKTA
ncbi:hypothetical protein CEXT_273991 [Caerostris extrusa]|uniref:Uncharacterized protein n=1 Tax=Caerostris extrusa TaxID=172846 RepID=A0AAV4XD80_CAEEX|nr:hypothetical protein CEXT_273991 [Caerostris extrusa]